MDIAEIRRKAKHLKEIFDEPVEVLQSDELPLMAEELEEVAAKPNSVEVKLKTEVPSDEHSAKEESKVEDKLETVARKPGPLETEWTEDETEKLNEAPIESVEQATDEEAEVITFLLDNEEYAVDIHQVKEVVKMRELTEIPRAPRGITGIISLRGAVIPIMNLRGRLAMPLKEDGERIIIVKDGANLMGLIVDSVRHVVRVPRKSIEPPPVINTIDGEFIRGIGRYNGGMFILLDMEKILEKV